VEINRNTRKLVPTPLHELKKKMVHHPIMEIIQADDGLQNLLHGRGKYGRFGKK